MSGNNRPGNNSLTNNLTWITDINNLQLDIVGFLAILGEGSVLANAQVSALSKWSLLPRLIPAPQALLRTNRPDRLHGAGNRVVISAQHGNIRHHLNHVADILHSRKDAGGESLAPFSVKVVRLVETHVHKEQEIKANALGPPTLLNMLGCLLSVLLVAFSVLQGDGFSLFATVLLALLSSLVGIGSFWKIKLPVRTTQREVKPSDIIIYYPQGTFLIVKDCAEEVARKLYFAPEECIYFVGQQIYLAIALLGTLLLMGGVISLANANTYSQLAFAAAYIILNAAYWIVAALPRHWNWDLREFRVTPIHVSKGYGTLDGIQNKNYTEALWNVIAVTQTSRWARVGSLAPNTEQWDAWLELAEARASEGEGPVWDHDQEILRLPEWDPSDAYTQITRNWVEKGANGSTPQFATGASEDANRRSSVAAGTLRERRVTPPTWVQLAAADGDNEARLSMEQSSASHSIGRERSTSRDGRSDRRLRAFRPRSREADPESGLHRLSADNIPRSVSQASVHSAQSPGSLKSPSSLEKPTHPGPQDLK